MKCKHQFMYGGVIKDTISYNYESSHDAFIAGKITPVTLTGTNAVCALCGERRIVWETGKIDIYDKKSGDWKELQIKPTI